ncbi:MAG: D-alanine--D-alanine ligase family protein [Candidatus Amoebophilus sp.]
MENKIRVGIFLGGSSREREISFAGGRTVYDNLDKGLFEPIPIFVDSFNNFIQLDWRYLYQGSIRDFYPPSDMLSLTKFQIYMESLGNLSPDQLSQYMARVGKKVTAEQLKEMIDFAFLALHGPCGEDGSIQGLLEWYKIPYSGSGILGTAVGIDKIVQKKWMQQAGFLVTPYSIIDRNTWQKTTNKDTLFEELIHTLGLPLVIKSPRQGSSIGVNIVYEKDFKAFTKAIHASFFIEQVTAKQWQDFSPQAKEQWLIKLVDLRSGIGLPVEINGHIIYHPEALLSFVDDYFNSCEPPLDLVSLQGEEFVLVESFITGREFSCIVLQEAGNKPVALPPTEMLKGNLHFDYRAKYLPGLVRKQTPMTLPLAQLNTIKEACVQLFESLNFQVYARIDGIFSSDNKIYLNDPNTTAGMNPSSFLFHQAAEIGLNPSQLLTFLIRNSLAARIYNHTINLKATKLLRLADNYVACKISGNKQ